MGKTKKVAIISDSVSLTTGNAKVARGLLQGLGKLGYDVYNIALGGDEPEDVYQGIKMRPIAQYGMGNDQVNVLINKLTLYLERDRYDYVIILGDKVVYQQYALGNISKEFLKKCGTKLIFWETVDSNVMISCLSSYTNAVPKQELYRACDHVVTTSHYGKKVLEHEFVKVDKVIWEFADTEEFTPVSDEKKVEIRKKYRFKKDDLIFLTVGRCMRRKNHELVLDAIYPLLIEYPNLVWFGVIPEYNKRDDLHLVDYCSRVLTGKYGGRDLIDEQKICFCTIGKKSMVLSMGVDDNEMVMFHQLSDAFVLGTSNEGFNLNFGEAMSVGNPYIGLDNTTMPELTNNGEVGFIAKDTFEVKVDAGIAVKTCSPESLREQMRKVIELTPEERKKLKEKNRKYVENNLSKSKCIGEWVKFFKEIEVNEK